MTKQIVLMYPTNALVDVDDDVYEKASKYTWDQIVDHGVPRFFAFAITGEKIWLHKMAARVDQRDTTVQFVRCRNKNYYDLRSKNLVVGRNRKNIKLPVGVVQKGTGFAGLVYVARQRVWTDITDTPEEAAVLYRKLKLEIAQKITVEKHTQLTRLLQEKLSDRLKQLNDEQMAIKLQIEQLRAIEVKK